jgi:mannosyltransferase
MKKNKFLTKNNYILFIIIVIALILRIYHLDYQSMWIDELWSYNAANPNNTFFEIYEIVKADGPHPPLYYYLLKITFHLFGYSSVSLRLLSVIFGTIGVYGIYLLGKISYNEKLGFVAALLLAINPFHIEYSQEGRMYALLATATIFSFYFLIKFLKQQTTKHFIFYLIFSVMMIYTHLYGLFSLVAQYIIFFVFLISNNNTKKIPLLIKTITGGILLTLTYIPVFDFLIKNKDRKDNWIGAPEKDFLYQTINSFFGENDLLTIVILLLIVFVLYHTFKSKINIHLDDLNKKNNLNIIIYICCVWLVITISIPFYISIIKMPIIVNRYFINILPALILLLSIGIIYIKNKVFKNSILTILITAALIQLFIVNQYYNRIHKSQFREVSKYILINKNQNNNTDFVSDLSVYYDTYLKNELEKKISNFTIDEYINEIKGNNIELKEFWYASGHGLKYDPNNETLEFLNNNFIIANSIDMYGSWAKHFIPITQFKPRVFNLNPSPINHNIQSWMDNFDIKDGYLSASAWAFLEDLDSQNSKSNFVLIDKDHIFLIPSYVFSRPDVVSHFNKKDYENSGITTKIPLKIFPENKYNLGILIQNKDQIGLYRSDNEITINLE